MDNQAVKDGRGTADSSVLYGSIKQFGPALRVKDKKKVAKAGMMISLGSLVLTGLMHFKGHKCLHSWSGIALIGFSIWHHNLNKRQSR